MKIARDILEIAEEAIGKMPCFPRIFQAKISLSDGTLESMQKHHRRSNTIIVETLR